MTSGFLYPALVGATLFAGRCELRTVTKLDVVRDVDASLEGELAPFPTNV
jgi:hypothetical protein